MDNNYWTCQNGSNQGQKCSTAWDKKGTCFARHLYPVETVELAEISLVIITLLVDYRQNANAL